jgi:hypothetical protein
LLAPHRDFESGNISGTISAQIVGALNFAGGGGTGLIKMDSNQVQGTIPPSICSLSGLKGLSIGGNQLEGRIPDCIGTLTDLTFISLWNNKLTGARARTTRCLLPWAPVAAFLYY